MVYMLCLHGFVPFLNSNNKTTNITGGGGGGGGGGKVTSFKTCTYQYKQPFINM